ncbi:PLP-dependent aminotransferase family protein [Natronoglycomyces albus]|uniref:aminotransferase-like domain-containing protein n=1 Tax=Natronoglycomyces albus TaxID=2811108 RepID=UPI001FE9C091|nr:PLP-dependent aminotransferase family protein [Natronoglycomyces albus]
MSGTTLDDFTGRYAQRIHGMAQSEIRALFSVASRPEVVSLAGGNPYTAALPMDELSSMFHDLLHTSGPQSLMYCPGQGNPRLRELLSELMSESGIDSSPDDITITTGAQQGLDLIARVFLDPGDIVLAEGPTYVGALGVFQAAQADVRHLPMDEDGLLPDALRETLAQLDRLGRSAKFLYLVPTYQNPAGVTLSEERRDEVVAICHDHGLLIVEDDPYSQLTFDSTDPTCSPAVEPLTPASGTARPPAPLRARTDWGIIYVGTLSKIFAAGLRLGWVLAPPAVRDKLVLAAEASILCPSAFTQEAAVRFFTTMAWREQIKSFIAIYQERRDTLLNSLSAHMDQGVTWTKPGGGMFVWAQLPEGLNSKTMLPRALNERVAYVPGTGFFADGGGQAQMRLNFSFPSAEEIQEGVRRLAGVISEEMALRASFDR